MIPINYLYAIVLLSAPAEEPVPAHIAANFDRLSPVLRHVALGCEVMDPREGPGKDRKGHVLVEAGGFETDVEMIRRRMQRLKDAPALFDHVRFPPRSVVNQWLELNRKHKKLLEARQKIDVVHDSWYREAISETNRLYEIWSTIKETRCEHYFVHYRRGALKKVREMIGHPAFYGGNYPPPLPLRRADAIH